MLPKEDRYSSCVLYFQGNHPTTRNSSIFGIVMINFRAILYRLRDAGWRKESRRYKSCASQLPCGGVSDFRIRKALPKDNPGDLIFVAFSTGSPRQGWYILCEVIDDGSKRLFVPRRALRLSRHTLYHQQHHSGPAASFASIQGGIIIPVVRASIPIR